MMQQVLLDFKEPTISDRDWVTELTSYANFNNSEYSFGSTYMWRRYINKRITDIRTFFWPGPACGNAPISSLQERETCGRPLSYCGRTRRKTTSLCGFIR